MTKPYFNILTNILLISIAIYFGVETSYRITTAKLDHVHPPKQTTAQASPVIDKTRQPFSYYQTILQRDLFNTKREAKQEVNQVDIETLKQTDLQMKLWGTVTGEGSIAYAVIEETETKKQNLYKVGDSIQNATVKLILRDKVVLSVDGRDEILEMEESLASKKDTKIPSIPEIAYAEDSYLDIPNIANITAEEFSKMTEAASEINHLMSQIHIRPHILDDRPDGVIVSNIKQDSIFNEMGLEDGDIIRKVDGKHMGSIRDALELFETLRTSSAISLEIDREGEAQTIDYENWNLEEL